MSSLLIYNDNITPDFIYKFKNKIGDTIPFSISNQTLSDDKYSFDNVVSDFLLELSEKKYEVIFIPLNLSISNYLEFTGLKLGYHIRLTENFINQETAIVFVGEEESFEINKLTIYGDILHCPKIFLTNKMDVIDFTKQIDFIKSIKNENVLSTFLKKIKLEPSGNYATHHSLANEWSIIRWSNALNLLNDHDSIPVEIKTIENKINNNLYYKYLKCKYPIKKSLTTKKELLKLKFNGRLLFIDDEIEKGWNEIFCSLFWDGDINKIENYESIGEDFKDLNQDEIIKLSVNKARNFDVVILDFRLTDNDFYESDPTKITGFKILENIKIHNPGIQVIIFSASNKIWNLQALQDKGANGFIIKESPENTLDAKFTINSIHNIITTIDKCFAHSFKKIYIDKCKIILKNLQINFSDENEFFLSFIKTLIKQLKNIENSILKIELNNNVSIDIVFLLCYNFLELFKEYYLNENEDYRFYLGFEDILLNRISVKDKKLILNNEPFIRDGKNDKPSWFQTIAGLLINYFNISNNPYSEIIELHKLSKARNSYIHEDKLNFKITEIESIIDIIILATQKIKE